MRIDIGHINKRINSTKTKFTKSYSNVTVRLKEPTSVINPIFTYLTGVITGLWI